MSAQSGPCWERLQQPALWEWDRNRKSSVGPGVNYSWGVSGRGPDGGRTLNEAGTFVFNMIHLTVHQGIGHMHRKWFYILSQIWEKHISLLFPAQGLNSTNTLLITGARGDSSVGINGRKKKKKSCDIIVSAFTQPHVLKRSLNTSLFSLSQTLMLEDRVYWHEQLCHDRSFQLQFICVFWGGFSASFALFLPPVLLRSSPAWFLPPHLSCISLVSSALFPRSPPSLFLMLFNSSPSPVFFTLLTPPAPHPLVSLVCVKVQ